MLNFTRQDFPTDFLFGTATSAYQIEGHSYGGAGRTHWDDFAATPGNVVNAENGAKACDHYHRFTEDLDLVQQSNLDAYRFSTSWARVLPEGKGKINQAGLDFYDRLVDAMLERQLKPCLTLYHWELPSALADLGGWRNRDIAHWFTDYADIITARLGDRLHSVAPINEPWCVTWLSHFLGAHAPGLRDIRATARAMHHVLLAHGQATQAMRSNGINNLGAVVNMEWAHPTDKTPESALASARHDAIYNDFFLSGLFKGEYPKLALEGLETHLPQHWQDDLDVISSPLDWCGINYYTRVCLKSNDQAWPHYEAVPGPLSKTQMGWEVYPRGLTDFLLRTARNYTGELPLYVTENGMANADVLQHGAVADPERINYLNQHLHATLEAIRQGAPVKGYFAWSLLDNYEWSLGYEKRFGLVHVDFDSLERTPKQSYFALQAALRRH